MAKVQKKIVLVLRKYVFCNLGALTGCLGRCQASAELDDDPLIRTRCLGAGLGLRNTALNYL